MLSLAWKSARALGPALCDLPLRAAIALGGAGASEPPRPDRLWKACAIIIPVATATWWAIPQLTWVVSPSIPAWAVRAAPGPIRRGDYVSFWLSHPLAGPRPVSVTKRALCMPGDRLSEHVRLAPRWPGHSRVSFSCNGVLLGTTKPTSAKGQTLTPFNWAGGPIPPGFAYVGSRHPDGFDSRYYGLVAISRLTRMERVL